MHSDFRSKDEAETPQHFARLTNHFCTICRRLEPDGGDAQQGPRVAGTKCADPNVMISRRIEESLHMFRLQAAITELCDGACSVRREPCTIGRINPGLSNDLRPMHRTQIVLEYRNEGIDRVVCSNALLD